MVDQTSSECIVFSFIDLKEKGKIRKVASDAPLLKYFSIGETKISINSIWQLHKDIFIIHTSSFNQEHLEKKAENKNKYANCFKIAMIEDKGLGEIIPFKSKDVQKIGNETYFYQSMRKGDYSFFFNKSKK